MTTTQAEFYKTAMLVCLKIRTPPNPPAPVEEAVKAVRTFHHENTLPWLDEGERIIPSMNYFPNDKNGQRGYVSEFQGLRDRFEQAVREHARADAARYAVEVVFKPADPNAVPVELSAEPVDAVEAAPASAPVPEDADGVVARLGEFMES